MHTHVFVGAVGARSNQSNFDFQRPTVLLGVLPQLADGAGQIRSERSVNVRLQCVQIDFDNLIVRCV